MRDLEREVRAFLPAWNHYPPEKGVYYAEKDSLFVEFTGGAQVRCVIGTPDLEDGVGYGKTVYEAFTEAKSCAIKYARARKERVVNQLALLEDLYGEATDE